MSVVDGINQVTTALSRSFLVTKKHVFETVDENPTVMVRMTCSNPIQDLSELTTLMRTIRRRIPKTHTVKVVLKTVL